MKINNTFKIYTLATLLALPVLATPLKANYSLKEDCFIQSVTPQGCNDSSILKQAPKPNIDICGVTKNAKIIVDIGKNILYKYNNGIPENAYLIASGKKSTPTSVGVRIVTHTETYPYRYAPRKSKRRRHPRDYGPNIICVNKLNPKTGEQSSTGEFIHGTNNPASIGKYASHGCMRMDNDIIQILAKEVKPGDIIIIKK